MTSHLIISIDTEIDKSKDWRVSTDESFSSVVQGIPEKLENLFSKYGAKPTYLLSLEVIRNDMCISILSSLTNCELGTHLHGEMIEPFRQRGQMANMITSAMQSSYPFEIERQKLLNLTQLFVSKFHYRPISHRAGRFGAGSNTLKILKELGYRVDSSITPGLVWNYNEGNANYVEAQEQPYYPDQDDIVKYGDSEILEVPITVFQVPKRMTWQSKILRSRQEKLNHLRWLRPSFNSGPGMINIITNVLNYYNNINNYNNDITLNMMFHSMEIMPGASPYAAKDKDCNRILDRIEKVLAYSKDNNFRFSTLGEMPDFIVNNMLTREAD